MLLSRDGIKNCQADAADRSEQKEGVRDTLRAARPDAIASGSPAESRVSRQARCGIQARIDEKNIACRCVMWGPSGTGSVPLHLSSTPDTAAALKPLCQFRKVEPVPRDQEFSLQFQRSEERTDGEAWCGMESYL